MSLGPLELLLLLVVLLVPALIMGALATVYLRSRGARADEARRIEALESRVRDLERP